MPYNNQRLLGPGSRYFDERILRDKRYQEDITRYGKEPVETEIRDFVPDPNEVGDFGFSIEEDELKRKRHMHQKRRSTRL